MSFPDSSRHVPPQREASQQAKSLSLSKAKGRAHRVAASRLHGTGAQIVEKQADSAVKAGTPAKATHLSGSHEEKQQAVGNGIPWQVCPILGSFLTCVFCSVWSAIAMIVVDLRSHK